MKLFKNFKTKKQLREEIESLKSIPMPLFQADREIPNTIKLVYTVQINERDSYIPMERIKKEIAYNLVKELEPHIEYQTNTNYNDPLYPKKEMRGTIRVIANSKGDKNTYSDFLLL